MTDNEDKITIESITSPNRTGRVNRAKYLAMREALIGVLPTDPPGLTVAEATRALLPILSQEHFPGGNTAGWWLKAVQLDLEAKHLIERGSAKPVRLFRIPEKA